MTTYLAVKGKQYGEILVDVVKESGETIRHLYRHLTRPDAYCMAARIVANNSETLVALNLKPGNYVLVGEES